ncbi:MAG: CPBP family intramembrane metalloprotease [Bifidobacteriaceae bacterium]|nr:CPBP family intramembrane metalloprotease [Bifidobacteriaceae bacterium]
MVEWREAGDTRWIALTLGVVAEEMFFQRYIASYILAVRYSDNLSRLVAALWVVGAFVLVHSPQPWESAVDRFASEALYLGYYDYTGTVLPGVCLHLLSNAWWEWGAPLSDSPWTFDVALCVSSGLFLVVLKLRRKGWRVS